MKKIVFVSSLLWAMLFSVNSHAQQNPLSGQYMFTPMVLNPAYAGFHDMLSTTGSYRNQWRALESGGLETYLLNAHSSLPLDKMGVGLTYVQDNFGIQQNSELTIAGSYRIKMEHNTFAFGLQGGFVNYRLDYSKLNQKEFGADVAFQADEDGINNITRPNFGFGAMYLTKRYFLGFSIPRLIESNHEVGYSLYLRHYYGLAGYVINLRKVKIKPSVLVKAVEGGAVSYDFNTSVLIYNTVWVGASLRDFSDFALMGQLSLSRYLKVGYSFEVPFNEDIRKAGGDNIQLPTHEIMINMNFKVFDVQAVQGFLF
ncbi:MAG: type IX secretion system membrane protein PorP/SprF [Cytophagales bacterium]|nr:type IX secretion system membrane protein PorP/SprF [Cytophagales bacterium]